MSKQNQLRFFRSFADDLNRNNHQWKEQYLKALYQMNDLNNVVKKCLQEAQLDLNYSTDAKTCLQGFIASYKKLKQQINHKQSYSHRLKSQLFKKDEQLVSKQKEIEDHKKIIKENKRAYDLQIQQQKAKYKLLERQTQDFDSKYQRITQELQNTRSKIAKIANEISTQNRKRMQQIILSHKIQIKDLKKNVQTLAWTAEAQLKKQIDSKNDEIKKLIMSISKMMDKKNDELQGSNNWKVLQTLMQPYKNYKSLTQQLSESRQKNSEIKLELRKINEQLLAEQIKKLQAQKKQQQMRSQYDTLVNQIKILKKQNVKIKKEFIQIKQSKDNLVNYYDNKWIQQFNSVRANLQKKFQEEINQKENQYRIKDADLQNNKMQLQAQFKQLQQERYIWGQQLKQMGQKLQDTLEKYSKECFLTNQLRSIIRQCQSLQKQQILIIKHEKSLHIEKLTNRIQQLLNEIQQHKIALNDFKKSSQKQMTNRQKQFQICIQQINNSHSIEKEQIQKKYKSIIQQKQLSLLNLQKRLAQTIKQHKQQLQNQIKKIKQNQHTLLVNSLNRQKDSYQKQMNQLNRKIEKKDQEINKFKKINQYILELQHQISILKATQVRLSQQFEIQKLQMKSQHSQELDRLRKQMKQIQYQLDSTNILLTSKEKRMQQLKLDLEKMNNHQEMFENSLKKVQSELLEELNTIKTYADENLRIERQKYQQLQQILQNNKHSFITTEEKQIIKGLMLKNQKLEMELSQTLKLNTLLNHDKKFALNKLRQTQQQIGIQYDLKQRQVFLKRPKAIPINLLTVRQKSQQFIKRENQQGVPRFKINSKRNKEKQKNLQKRTNSVLM